MSNGLSKVGGQVIVDQAGLQELVDALVTHGYRVLGPQVKDGAVVLEDLNTVAALPAGWTDEQGAGTYRLVPSEGAALFAHNVGPQSWKQFLHPPSQRLWRTELRGRTADGRGDGWRVVEDKYEAQHLAFFGVRPCDLHAIEIQDRVFLRGLFVEPGYKSRRDHALIIAVNCTRAGANCFCTSMGYGPRAETGFDLALTEIAAEDRHCYLVDVGTETGSEILAKVQQAEASREDIVAAVKLTNDAASQMGYRFDAGALKQELGRRYDSPEWGRVAERCLSCSNCTQVCPTCFCTTIEDKTDVPGEVAERWRKWDSCFSLDFSYIHGGSIRSSVSSRYRQWLIHKLATWGDQFGTPGCVGCGRCITWCPVGIDITHVARAVQASDGLELVSNTEDRGT